MRLDCGPLSWIDAEELKYALDVNGLAEGEAQHAEAPKQHHHGQHRQAGVEAHAFMPASSIVPTNYEVQPHNNLVANASHHFQSRLPGILNDTPDLLMQIANDGSLIVWGVQYLSEEPRRTPRVVLVMRNPQAVSPYDSRDLWGELVVFTSRRTERTPDMREFVLVALFLFYVLFVIH